MSLYFYRHEFEEGRRVTVYDDVKTPPPGNVTLFKGGKLGFFNR